MLGTTAVLFALAVICASIGLAVFFDINLMENWLGYNEYQVAAMHDQFRRALPTLWLGFLAIVCLVLLLTGVAKRKKAIIYWLVTLVLIPLVWLFLGVGLEFLPVDRQIFREEKQLAAVFQALSRKAVFQDKDPEVVSLSLHIRNVATQSAVYSVLRLVNPTTQMQDEYWYYPLRLIRPWLKSATATPLSLKYSLPLSRIDWAAVPRMLQDAEARLQTADRYYRGVGIVILIPPMQEDGAWTWSVGIQDARGRTSYHIRYSLQGDFLHDR